MKILMLKKEQFIRFINGLKITNRYINLDIVYSIYVSSLELIQEITSSNSIANLQFISSFEIVLYSLGEYLYISENKTREEIDSMMINEQFISSISTLVADKYISLSAFGKQEEKFTNKYIPSISTMKVYLNFMQNILSSYEKNDPKLTLITDLLTKSISIASCILDLLNNGYETEAFSSWRTLHECECTLILLDQNGDKTISTYLKHMKYAIAYKSGLKTKEETDLIFGEIKTNMKKHDLKSKDMKKYIEYGWIYSLDEVNENTINIEYKLNFRDGVEKLAGLKDYATRYELSSEIIHSTPILIYSNKQHFFFLTLLSLYESFFRLEKIFVNLFIKKMPKVQIEGYSNLRKIYYSQLVKIYERELNKFNNLKNK